MEAKELRIGNLVHYNANQKEVGTITGMQSAVSKQCYIYLNNRINSVLDLEEIKPIPLTDEWLFKFGFIKMKNYRTKQLGHSKYDWFKDNTQFFSIEKHHSGDFNEGETFYPTFTFNNCSFALQYVHQLQNLYFSLTKDELKINDINE
mgnify:CR=1 FL=1